MTMKLSLRKVAFLLALILSCESGIFAQQGPAIQKIEIRHVGPAAASDSLILANVRVKEGDPYNRTSVDDDVRNLYATGLFHNIRVSIENIDNGIKLIYVVQGKPTLSEVRFEGNKKFSRKKLLKRVTSKVGEPLNERKLFSDTQEIYKMYQKSGYQKTQVKYTTSIEEASGRGVATFEITEAPKVKIERVEFNGNEAIKERKLRRTVKTRKHWMFSWLTGSGVVKDDVMEEDEERLKQFYQEKGYIDFEIKKVDVEQISPKKAIVRWDIVEGQQYKVGSVDFKNNTLFTDEEIREGITSQGKRIRPKMVEGEIFTPKGLADDLEAIRDFYGAKGYIDTWPRPVKNANVERGTMDLVYEIQDEDKGKSFVEKIEIQGNTKTKDKVIRRELAISPGETFDMVRVKISKSRLEQMGYFEKVEADPEPTEISPNRKNLVIDVEEGNTGHIEFGAGFSSIDSLFGFVGYREGNFDLFNPPYFRGGGQKLRVGATVGLRRKDYQLSFVEPWFLNRRLALGVDLYYSEMNFLSDVYDLTQAGTRLSLTRSLPMNLVGSVSYTLENITIEDVDASAPQVIKDEEGSTLVSKIGASLAHDTRNSVQLPSRGERTELFGEIAGGPLGAEADFYKLKLSSDWYFPGFFEDHVWIYESEIGVVDEYGDSNRVPLFDRYFLGGSHTLRGFRYRHVGPRVGGEPVGGETYWFGSLEYSIPIIERLRFALFYDIGNVYQDAYSFETVPGQKIYNDNWGVGIRLNIPRMGPLRLDYGIPITRNEDTSGTGRFNFSVGFTRDY
ncbi:MAG TPA: outer membrane protein assembly factor BamA [Methylomirabilota bacterium]|nr:outer membrane protein assembly factor BamA [Methylomirabilota bacterium]